MSTSPTPEPTRTLLRPGPTRRASALDLAVFVTCSLAFFGIEELLRHAGRFPYPGLFDGGPTLVASFLVMVSLVRWRGQRGADLGLRRPARWWTVPVWALAVVVANVAAQLTVVPVIASATGAPEPDLSRYDLIRGNLPMFLVATAGTMLTGGFIEEVLYRGLMVDRLARILGGDRRALVLGALLCGVPFGLVHFAWGIGGILVTTVMGSVMGLLYLATRRNLWPLVAGHALLDALLMVQVYLGAIE